MRQRVMDLKIPTLSVMHCILLDKCKRQQGKRLNHIGVYDSAGVLTVPIDGHLSTSCFMVVEKRHTMDLLFPT